MVEKSGIQEYMVEKSRSKFGLEIFFNHGFIENNECLNVFSFFFFLIFSVRIVEGNLPNNISSQLILAFIQERSLIVVSIAGKNSDISPLEITTSVKPRVARSM